MGISTIDTLVVKIAADTVGFEKGTLRSRLALSGLKTGAIAAAGALTGIGIGPALMIAKVGSAAKLAAGGLLALGAAGEGAVLAVGVKLAAEFEQLTVSFETMLKSAPKAVRLLDDISSFAAKTPLRFGELADAARSLTAFGVSSDQIIPSLRVLGDIASGIGQPINEIAEIYGKARVQGRLFAEDINQFTGRGIPVVTELSKKFGVTGEQLKKMVEEGKVGFSDLQEVFINLTKAGGQFAGMMEKQSQTVAGKWSTVSDNIAIAVRHLGEFTTEVSRLPALMDLAIRASEKLSNFHFASGEEAMQQFEKNTSLFRGDRKLALESAEEHDRRRASQAGVRRAFGLQTDDSEADIRRYQQRVQSGFYQRADSPLKVEGQRAPDGGTYDPKARAEMFKRFSDAFDKRQKELADRQEHVRKNAMDEMEGFAAAGRRAFDDTRTPAEKYKSTIAELVKLLAVGAINLDTFRRAKVKAFEDMGRDVHPGFELMKPLEAPGKAGAIDTRNPRALQAGTAEFFTAAERSNQKNTVEQNTKNMLDEEKKGNVILRGIQSGVQTIAGNLNVAEIV